MQGCGVSRFLPSGGFPFAPPPITTLDDRRGGFRASGLFSHWTGFVRAASSPPPPTGGNLFQPSMPWKVQTTRAASGPVPKGSLESQGLASAPSFLLQLMQLPLCDAGVAVWLAYPVQSSMETHFWASARHMYGLL